VSHVNTRALLPGGGDVKHIKKSYTSLAFKRQHALPTSGSCACCSAAAAPAAFANARPNDPQPDAVGTRKAPEHAAPPPPPILVVPMQGRMHDSKPV
jgi:hypothetical protein